MNPSSDAPGTRLEKLRLREVEIYKRHAAWGDYEGDEDSIAGIADDAMLLVRDVLALATHEREERERLEREVAQCRDGECTHEFQRINMLRAQALQRASGAEQERDALRTALDGVERKFKDATKFCNGDWPCEASTSAASFELHMHNAEERADALAAENARLRDALTFIEVWNLPMVHSRIDDRDVPYGVDFGSNGERDYMRDVARKALTRPLPPR